MQWLSMAESQSLVRTSCQQSLCCSCNSTQPRPYSFAGFVAFGGRKGWQALSKTDRSSVPAVPFSSTEPVLDNSEPCCCLPCHNCNSALSAKGPPQWAVLKTLLTNAFCCAAATVTAQATLAPLSSVALKAHTELTTYSRGTRLLATEPSGYCYLHAIHCRHHLPPPSSSMQCICCNVHTVLRTQHVVRQTLHPVVLLDTGESRHSSTVLLSRRQTSPCGSQGFSPCKD